MKKTLQLFLIFAFTLLSTSCKNKAPNYDNVDKDVLITTYLEAPQKLRPKSQDPMDNIFIALNVLNEASSFESSSTGEVVAKKAIVLQTQKLETNRAITPYASFIETKSISSFVKFTEQIYQTENTILKRDAKKVKGDTVTWASNVTNLTEEEYLDTHGYPIEIPTRYIINKHTISSKIDIKNNGIGRKYTYKFSLDPHLSTYYYRTNIKNTANSSSYPIFKNIDVTMTFDYKWRMTKIETYEEYSIEIKGLGTVNCTASITEMFKNINKNVEIKEESFFKKHL